MTVKILTDSTADIRGDEIKKFNVDVIPLNVEFGTASYQDGVTISPDEFYKKLVEEKEFPKTSQPAPGAFLEFFEAAKKKGEELIYLSISSGLSGTINSARIAQEMCGYDGIYVVDTLESIQGLHIVVEEACKLRDEGKSAKEIADYVEDLKGRIHILSAIDTLAYLRKGGRLSAAGALIGNLINLKINVDLNLKGSIRVYGKCIGIQKAYRSILAGIEKDPIDFSHPVQFGYTDSPTNLNILIEKIRSVLGNISYTVSQIGPAIGSHIGPGGFDVAYVSPNPRY